jgi:CRP-like cAMP-binding protein
MTTTDTETILPGTLDTEVFTGVPQENIDQLLSHPEVKRVTLSQGQYIYHHGDTSESFFIIITGEIVAQVQSLRHPFNKVRYCPGDITGLRGIVDPGKPRPVSMIADSTVELIEIPGKVVMAMDAAVWGTIMTNISKILLERLLDCHSKMDH